MKIRGFLQSLGTCRHTRSWVRSSLLVAAVLGVIGCADLMTPPPPQSGLYNLTGWNQWTADINGEVGYPLNIGAPTANCRPSRNWTLRAEIVSGQLPPGIEMRYSDYQISGIPTDRGHYIVMMRVYDVQCEGKYYEGFTQELRFHITGSGRVVR